MSNKIRGSYTTHVGTTYQYELTWSRMNQKIFWDANVFLQETLARNIGGVVDTDGEVSDPAEVLGARLREAIENTL